MLGHRDSDTESALIPRSSPAHSKAVAKARHPQHLLWQLLTASLRASPLSHRVKPDWIQDAKGVEDVTLIPETSPVYQLPPGLHRHRGLVVLGRNLWRMATQPFACRSCHSSTNLPSHGIQGFLLLSFESVSFTGLKPQPSVKGGYIVL